MNREIKFKAKRIDNGEWIYGSLINNEDTPRIIINSEYSTGTTYVSYAPRIDRNTIGQFTGICDKNGKEIYEGDIVKAKYIEKRNFNGVKYDNEMEFSELVVWRYQSFQLELDNCGIKMYRHLNFYEDLNNIKLKELKVIGNIFDNKELLGE